MSMNRYSRYGCVCVKIRGQVWIFEAYPFVCLSVCLPVCVSVSSSGLRGCRTWCCLCTVGQLVHTLPEGPPVWGVTSLADELYLLRSKGERDQVEVYDVVTYCLQRCLTVPNARTFTDLTSCEYYCCVYIGDDAEYVHRLDVQGTVTRWAVNDRPRGLSVNVAHNVLVTCLREGKIKEFGSRGYLLRELTLPGDVVNPWHAIQTRGGKILVCHGHPDDPVHRVCTMGDDGRHIVHSHGGYRGSNTGQYHVPVRLAVDDNEFVFVADVNNRRVTLLSPTLKYLHLAVSRDQLKWRPRRLHYNTRQRHLYVADNDDSGDVTAGRVVVYSVDCLTYTNIVLRTAY